MRLPRPDCEQTVQMPTDKYFHQNQAVSVDYIPCKLTLIAAYLILSSDLCSSSKPIELVTVVKMQVKRMG